VIEIKSV
jgi:hypothetical protein